MILRTRSRTIVFPRRTLVMGILNINDDSFCADGSLDPAWAEQRIRAMIAEGADIIDIGAESARTNRGAISGDEEIRRLRPCLEAFAKITGSSSSVDDGQVFPPLLSINTWRPQVADAALEIAGDILNDMSGLPDTKNAEICARHEAALLIMHTVGAPKVPHTHVTWNDIVPEMRVFFEERLARAAAAGLSPEATILDPGIDFAKQRDDNLRVLRELDQITALGRPVLVPVSRKSVIGDVLNQPNPADRDAGTVACIVASVIAGAAIVRVHNVRAAWQAVRTVEAVLRA